MQAVRPLAWLARKRLHLHKRRHARSCHL
jgi:hypothetical protein